MSLNCTTRRRLHRSGRIAAGGLILLPLISVSIGLLIYFRPVGKGGPDGEGKSYIETVFDARKSAQASISEFELLNFHKELRMYAINNDKYPSLDKLLDYSSIGQKLLDFRDGEQPLCIYIEGQSESSNSENVLVYEANISNGERDSGLVLLKNGLVQTMTANQIVDALQETEDNLAGR